ncbi:MAG: translocation/assembly module TamB domain-containing protein, partial [Gammaproteobacteria bacterium]|nr:translocation/assembly module TamB domain-containing protein [Gammaproteobacteria bacterium]
LIFAGPLTDPRVGLEAVREAVDITAGVRVTGQPSQPRITLFSDPYMEQASILAYLLTGRPPGEASASEEALLGQAALSLGVLGGGKWGTALAEQLGIRDFQLEARGQGEDAQVAISGYIAPNLLVRYGVNMFQPQNTLSLRYYLSRQLYLEAVTGGDSAVDVIYSFNYD